MLRRMNKRHAINNPINRTLKSAIQRDSVGGLDSSRQNWIKISQGKRGEGRESEQFFLISPMLIRPYHAVKYPKLELLSLTLSILSALCRSLTTNWSRGREAVFRRKYSQIEERLP